MLAISSKSLSILPAIAGVSPEICIMVDATADVLVREVISAHRADGLDRAFATAGRMFGFAARRARAYWHHEVTDPRESECVRIRAAYARWADLELQRLDAQRALLAARRDALWGSHADTTEAHAAAGTPLPGRPLAVAPPDARERCAA